MQSAPFNVIQKVSSQEPTPDNVATTSQHGLYLDHQPPSLLSRGEDERGSGSEILSTGSNSRLGSPGRVATGSEKTSRLSDGSPSSWTKIAEYENAMVNGTRKEKTELLFEVLHKIRTPEDKNCPIQKLPNGRSFSLCASLLSSRLTTWFSRALNARTFSSFPNRLERCIPCLSSVQRFSNYTSCLASSLRSIFSGAGVTYRQCRSPCV